ncbi:MAG: SMC-Scp complex subunit ScpB [Planctomycetia bacterium]|jgi:segregation and condensation protein B
MSENIPHHEPDDEPQILSFERLSQAFAKALSRKKGDVPAEEDREVLDSQEDEADLDADRAFLEDSVSGEAATEEDLASDEADEEFGEEDSSQEEETLRVSPHSILEAMLFVDDQESRPLEPARAAALMRGVEPDEVAAMVDDLNRDYRENNCPYEIVSTGGGFRMVLREAFYPVRNKFYGRVREARLSQAAIDVLALVAYKQPITADEVNKLRDKPSSHLLTQLVRRRLLCVERTGTKTRKTIYRTTDRFLELFGLDDPSDLPQIDEMDD